MNEEHPFAEYVRILGKGKNGSRSLKAMGTADSIDAAQAMAADMWKQRSTAWLNVA